MQIRQRQDRDLAAIFVCFLSGALIPTLCLCLCQCLLAVGKSLGSSSCSAARVGFTFQPLRPPDAALRLVPARAESCKTNLCGLPPFLSLPPSPDSFSPSGLASPLSLCLNHIQMGRLETERKSERGREKERKKDRERQMSNRGLLSFRQKAG